MGKDIKIAVPDGVTIYGRLDGELGMPLVVIVHGLPCSMYDGIYEQAATWFVEHGYAVFRWNLYSWQSDARQLIDCTIATHAADLDVVVRHFKDAGIRYVAVVGHSFGGPVILSSHAQQFDAAVLWDSSYRITVTKENYGAPAGRYLEEIDGYVMRWGATVVIGSAMARELDECDWDGLSSNMRVPTRYITAQNGVLYQGSEKYRMATPTPSDHIVISGATHYFDDTGEVRQNLYARTKEWLDVQRQ